MSICLGSCDSASLEKCISNYKAYICVNNLVDGSDMS